MKGSRWVRGPDVVAVEVRSVEEMLTTVASIIADSSTTLDSINETSGCSASPASRTIPTCRSRCATPSAPYRHTTSPAEPRHGAADRRRTQRAALSTKPSQLPADRRGPLPFSTHRQIPRRCDLPQARRQFPRCRRPDPRGNSDSSPRSSHSHHQASRSRHANHSVAVTREDADDSELRPDRTNPFSRRHA